MSLMATIFPQARHWKCVQVRPGVLCISRDQLPVCGRQSDRVFWTGGYTGHGLTWALEIADLIADSLMGDTACFDQLAALRRRPVEPFAPIRPFVTPLALAYFRFADRFRIGRQQIPVDHS